MKLPLMFGSLSAALALIFSPSHAAAQDKPEPPKTPPADHGPQMGGGQHEDSPVGEQMGELNRSVKKLSRQYSDPAQKASSLDLVAAMEKAVAKVKTLTPPKAEKLKGDEKKKYLDTYQKDLDDLSKEIAALKTAVAAGENDKTKAEIDKIMDLKNTSHKALGVGGGGGPRRGGPRGPGGPGGQHGPDDSAHPPAPAAQPSASAAASPAP